MADKKQIHALAVRLIKAQNQPDELKRKKAVDDIIGEAKAINVFPNQVLTYAMSNQAVITSEIEGQGVTNLTGFANQWKAANPSIDTNSPQFHVALAEHVKTVSNFDFYN